MRTRAHRASRVEGANGIEALPLLLPTLWVMTLQQASLPHRQQVLDPRVCAAHLDPLAVCTLHPGTQYLCAIGLGHLGVEVVRNEILGKIAIHRLNRFRYEPGQHNQSCDVMRWRGVFSAATPLLCGVVWRGHMTPWLNTDGERLNMSRSVTLFVDILC